ncbi:hypothetical protein [Agrilutibacter solisilvae]|uniref:Uncharacterized protein n=1 Tax=Agrilutibacter solisilvae TaxID=2763317 RepID=A0A975ATI7_9GAMM|nr:hypothetical protein [Lysobacter solisilvae]QSX79328.1 hypothetical protein I8J32_005510 [Lysobacter solisilvae]
MAASLDVLRTQLSEAARSAALQWRFKPSARREPAQSPFWLLRVPVLFNYSGLPYPPYGQWQGYLRGPWQLSPWFAQLDPDDVVAPPDALPSHIRYRAGSGLKLLTPLQ